MEMADLNLNVGDQGKNWIMHYCSFHQILIVGDGDFSFSASLATAFGSAVNITATSLDSKDDVIKKYKQGKSNLDILSKLGAYLLHGVDATHMKLHNTCLRIRRFDRIIFNFPHAGFHGREDGSLAIRMHRALILGFFKNASGMLRADGEVHVTHKTKAPFCHWNLEELANQNSLALINCADFKIEDYPGYNNKRGAGPRCDKSFPLGKCSTFMFIFSPAANILMGQTIRNFGTNPAASSSVKLTTGTKSISSEVLQVAPIAEMRSKSRSLSGASATELFSYYYLI